MSKVMNEAVMNRMRQTAAELAEMMDEQRAVEDRVKPLKDELIAYAKEYGIAEMVDLGALKLIPGERKKETVNEHMVTADWLKRYRKEGGRFEFKPRVDPKLDGDHYDALLSEIGYEVEIVTTYTLKRK